MNLKIFQDAFDLYQGGFVKPQSMSDRKILFIIDEIDVGVTHTSAGIKMNCGCEAHMKRMAQDKLCKRTISALVYIARQKKTVQSMFVQIAAKMSLPGRTWVDEATKSKVTFDIEGNKVWIERIATGTRVRTNKDEKVLQNKLSLEMIAAVLYTYDHRGKIKLR